MNELCFAREFTNGNVFVDCKSLRVFIVLTEEELLYSALWRTIRWTHHSINQYHISLWDIKRFVVHCHASLLDNTSTFPGSGNREQNQQNKYFTCCVTVCNESNSPVCSKDNNSGQNCQWKVPGTASWRSLWSSIAVCAQVSGWGTSQISEGNNLGLPGTLTSLHVQTLINEDSGPSI